MLVCNFDEPVTVNEDPNMAGGAHVQGAYWHI